MAFRAWGTGEAWQRRTLGVKGQGASAERAKGLKERL